MFRNKKAVLLVALLAIASFTVRFIFFLHPDTIVFDETYFLQFLGFYHEGLYFFDIHPPLGKLLLLLFAKIIGVTTTSNIGNIGGYLSPSLAMIRILPMLAGSIIPLVIYFICRRINLSVMASFLAGLLVCLENSLIVESRFVLMDSMLQLFGFLSLLFYLIYRDKHSKGNHSWRWLILSAVTFAATGSIKWSGLFFAFPIIIFEIHRYFVTPKTLHIRAKHFFTSFFTYFVTFALIYTSIFIIHFALLYHTGPGDAFMSKNFQSTLYGGAYYERPSLTPPKFFGKLFELNAEMFDANHRLDKTHQYSSKYYTWPLMLRPIYYWKGHMPTEDSSLTSTDNSTENISESRIYLLGNPFIYWFGTISMILLVMYLIISYMKRDSQPIKNTKAAFFIILVYICNLVPFALIGRVMFLYHYEASLIASIIAIAYLVDMIKSDRKKILIVTSIIILCAASFLYFSPISYGLPMTESQFNQRMWLKSWI